MKKSSVLFILFISVLFIAADKLPKDRIERRIRDLDVTESGSIPYFYMIVDKYHYCWINPDDSIDEYIGYKSIPQIKVKKIKGDKWEVDISEVKDVKWNIHKYETPKDWYLVYKIVE